MITHYQSLNKRQYQSDVYAAKDGYTISQLKLVDGEIVQYPSLKIIGWRFDSYYQLSREIPRASSHTVAILENGAEVASITGVGAIWLMKAPDDICEFSDGNYSLTSTKICGQSREDCLNLAKIYLLDIAEHEAQAQAECEAERRLEQMEAK